MAIAATNKTASGSSGDATSYNTASISFSSNALALAAVVSVGPISTTPNTPTASGAGLGTWVAVANVLYVSTGATRVRITVFRAMSASPGASAAVTFDFAGQTQRGCAWAVSQLTGTDTSGTNGSGAVGTAGTNSSSAATSLQVPAGSAAASYIDAVWGAVSHNVNEGSTVGPALTELGDANTGDALAAAALHAMYAIDLDNAQSQWSTSGATGGIAFIVKAASPPTSPTDWPEHHIEFNQAAPSAAENWVDVTAKVRGIDREIGRDFELDHFAAGKMVLRYDNSDGDFRPFNTSSVYYPNVKIKREFRWYVLWEGQKYHKFRGNIESITPTRELDYSEVNISVADAFKQLGRRTLVPSEATLTTSLGVSNGDLKYTARGRQGAQGAGSPFIGGVVLWGGSGPGTPIAASPGPAITIAYDASASDYPPPPGVDVSGNAITVTLHTVSGTPDSEARNIMAAVNSHVVAGRMVACTLAPANNGTGKPGSMSATALSGGYPQEASDQRVHRALDSINWSPFDRVFTAGAATIQATFFEIEDDVKCLGHIQDVQTTEVGQLYMDGRGRVVFENRTYRSGKSLQLTLSDNPAGGEYPAVIPQPAFDDARLANKIIVSRANGGTSTAEDATSQTDYDTIDLTYSHIASADSANATIASLLLARYKDQHQRYESITVEPVEADGMWDKAVWLGISEKVRVKETPPGSSAQSQDCYIEKVVDKVDLTADPYKWFITYGLSPV